MEIEFYNRDDDPLDSDGLCSSDKWYATVSKNWTETEKKKLLAR